MPGQTYDVIPVAFDVIHVFPECSLDGIAAGFVIWFPRIDVSLELFIAVVCEVNRACVIKTGFAACLKIDHANTCYNVMWVFAKHTESLESFLSALWFADDLVIKNDNGISCENMGWFAFFSAKKRMLRICLSNDFSLVSCVERLF